MIELKKFLNKENFIIPVVTIYMFFWDMPQTLGINLDFRLVIFGLSFFLLIELIKDIKNKNFTFIYISILIASLLIAHSFIVGNLLNIKFYFSIIFLIFIFGIAYYFYDVILENKKAIIYLFLVLFLSSIIIHFFRDFATNPEPVSCGAIKNFFLGNANNFGTPIFLIHFVSSYSLIFNENSHLAMSGVGAIIYSIFIITKDKKLMSSDYKNKLIFIMLILFIFICFLKSSATLLAGMFFSILTLIIFEYKTLGRYFIICSIILTSAISFIFFQDEVCLNKITLSTSQKDQFVKINPFSDSNKIQIEIDSLEDQLIEINKKLNNRNISEEEGSKVIKLKLVIENELINKNEDLKKKKLKTRNLKKNMLALCLPMFFITHYKLPLNHFYLSHLVGVSKVMN